MAVVSQAEGSNIVTPSYFLLHRPVLLQGSSTPCNNAPIQRLSTELLSHIFMIHVHDNYVNEPNDHHHDSPAQQEHGTDVLLSPVTLSHVCQRWRSIALSLGQLWTFIVLIFPFTHLQLSRMLHWLRRSKNYPLDILLDFRDEDREWEEPDGAGEESISEDVGDVMEVLAPLAPRWRSFEIMANTWDPIHRFLRSISSTTTAESLKNLEVFRAYRTNAYFVRRGECFHPASQRAPIPLFGTTLTPKLRTLSLVGVHVDWSSLPSRFEALEELELKYHAAEVMPTMEQFQQLMACASKLRTLIIMGWGPTPDGDGKSWDAYQRSIFLPNLTHFTCGYVDVAYAIDLIRLFSLPSLRHLTLEDLEGSFLGPHPLNSTSLLHRISSPYQSSPDYGCCDSDTSPLPLAQLETLTLCSVSAERGAFNQLLQSCQSLKVLSLDRRVDARVVVMALQDTSKLAPSTSPDLPLRKIQAPESPRRRNQKNASSAKSLYSRAVRVVVEESCSTHRETVVKLSGIANVQTTQCTHRDLTRTGNSEFRSLVAV